MTKTFVKQYFSCHMSADTERADYKGEEKKMAKPRTKTCHKCCCSCSELLYSILKSIKDAIEFVLTCFIFIFHHFLSLLFTSHSSYIPGKSRQKDPMVM